MAIDSCTLVSVDGHESRDGLEVVAMYRIKSDARTLAYQAQIDARGATPNPIPSINESFLDTIGPTASTTEFRVDGIFADDIRTKPVRGSEKIFICRVIYRNPSHPSSVSGRRSFGSPPDKDKPPEQRIPEVFTRTLVMTKPRDRGFNLAEIRWPFTENVFDEDLAAPAERRPVVRPAGTFGPITNAAGFRYGSIPELQVRLPVFIFRKAVREPFTYIPIHRDFANVTNSKPWQIFGKPGTSITPGRAMCWYVETGDPLYHGNSLYYEVEAAVIYDPETHLVRVRNEGDKGWVQAFIDGKSQARLEVPTRSGIPLQPPLPLNRQGQFKDDIADPVDVLEFRDLKEKDLSVLTTRLNNLR